MKHAMTEAMQQEDVKERRLNEGISKIETLERNLKKKLCKVQSSLETHHELPHQEQSGRVVSNALDELNSLESRTSASLSEVRQHKTPSTDVSREEQLRKALVQAKNEGIIRTGPGSTCSRMSAVSTKTSSTTKSSKSVESSASNAMLAEMVSSMAELRDSMKAQQDVMLAQQNELLNLKRQLAEKDEPPKPVLTPEDIMRAQAAELAELKKQLAQQNMAQPTAQQASPPPCSGSAYSAYCADPAPRSSRRPRSRPLTPRRNGRSPSRRC
jgi:hypothetical protein